MEQLWRNLMPLVILPIRKLRDFRITLFGRFFTGGS